MTYAASPPAAQEAAERLRAIAGERMAPADASPLAGPTWEDRATWCCSTTTTS